MPQAPISHADRDLYVDAQNVMEMAHAMSLGNQEHLRTLLSTAFEYFEMIGPQAPRATVALVEAMMRGSRSDPRQVIRLALEIHDEEHS